MNHATSGAGLPDWLGLYLERIGWNGAPPGADTGQGNDARAILEALIPLHTAAIAFENIDCLLHQPVDVTPAAVIDKLVRRRRGGYCFEQNILLAEVLTALGYRVEPLLARVLWDDPDPATKPRTHMALKITPPEGGVPWLADVGFGGNVLTGVLDFVSGMEQQTPHGPFRLIERRDGWEQQVGIAGNWRPTYLFSPGAVYPIDLVQANWWVSTHPDSKFRHILRVALAPPGRRYAMLNRHLTTYHADGRKEEEDLTAAETVERLSALFRIEYDDREAVIARLEGMTDDS